MNIKDTIPVRKGEELDLRALDSFLSEKIEGLNSTDPLHIQQFPAGNSNLTYQIKKGNWEAVLRRPPLGPVAPRAHDMGREFKIIQAIYKQFPQAPKPYLYTENFEIIGNPFIIMERKHGYVLDDEFPENVTQTESLCRHISEEMVETLVALHAIDYKETELINMVKPEGFMERQVKGWLERYERAKTDEIKGVEELTRWLASQIPVSQAPTIVHYDFKLNNMMFDYSFDKIIGLFDWEMTTVGDPLADLAGAAIYFRHEDDLDEYKRARQSLTTLPAFMTRNKFIEAYAQKSGRDVSAIHFYVTFAYFKLAVISQQIYYRYKRGQTEDKRFANLNKSTNMLIQQARYSAFSQS